MARRPPAPEDPGSAPCPCGLPGRYADCCARWHDGPERGLAPDAERLMRSRYSAFVLEREDVLLATWHASTRPPTIAFEPGIRWLGLTVSQHLTQGPDRATVQFVARSKQGGRAQRLAETSRFVRENGRWYYLDGDLADPTANPAR